ncbi:hypothetical protein AURDEDRAFT_176027 [Auricularia subglabra TFB-10046 SS5]|uniref:Uncharacterized protein n=1 Tax=Auricularia subglabra (strain TFB-10046 / SS5) TaxID=717982 RepID=J0D7A9_AURST|nr:hypothetical protein AURDEDRAFT_176027 [Auricularia subglabra TFB-10046 SS5]
MPKRTLANYSWLYIDGIVNDPEMDESWKLNEIYKSVTEGDDPPLPAELLSAPRYAPYRAAMLQAARNRDLHILVVAGELIKIIHENSSKTRGSSQIGDKRPHTPIEDASSDRGTNPKGWPRLND